MKKIIKQALATSQSLSWNKYRFNSCKNAITLERYAETSNSSKRTGTTFRLANLFRENPDIKYYSIAKE